MARPDEPQPPTGPGGEPSKTRRKAAMHALQELGEALAALEASRVAELDLPERLVEALAQVRRIRAHEGRRRQMQYIGKLMRDVDAEPIRQALDRWASGEPGDRAQFAQAEQWREKMLHDDAAVAEFMAAHPAADSSLDSLVRDARAERARGGPPHRYRELFRRIKAAVDKADG